jgi:hypothetical protein
MQRVGEIQLTNRSSEQTAIVKPPAERLKSCLALLLGLGEMRQTTLSAETQTVYARALADYEPRFVEAVITRLGRTPRGEYEKAIPELGELEAMVRAEVKSNKPPFVSCGQCMNGVVYVNGRGEPYKPTIDGHDRWTKACACLKSWRLS